MIVGTVCSRCATRMDQHNVHSYCPAGKVTQLGHKWVPALSEADKLKNDPISPSHYARFKIQPIEFIQTNGIDFMAGNVIKYVCRHDAKNGLEDLKKARSYLDRMIAAAPK